MYYSLSKLVVDVGGVVAMAESGGWVWSEWDFRKRFRVESKDVVMKGLDDIEKLYTESDTIYEFANKLAEYLGVDAGSDERYLKVFAVAGVIDAVVKALAKRDAGFSAINDEERMYG